MKLFLDSGKTISLEKGHTVISGSSGSGKSTTILSLVNQLYQNNIPVFITDIKGDMNKISKIHTDSVLYDSFCQKGYSFKFFISDLGLDTFCNFIDCESKVQKEILSEIFNENTITDCNSLLKILNNYLSLQDKKVSVNAIISSVKTLKNNNLDIIFTNDFHKRFDVNKFKFDKISILNCEKFFNNQNDIDNRLYTLVLTIILNKIFQDFPEITIKKENPELVIIFDEAHTIFKNKILTKIFDNLLKLIRSKGVLVILSSQSIFDISQASLAQISNKIQHKLNNTSPELKKDIDKIAELFKIDGDLIANFATGEAVCHLMDKDTLKNKPPCIVKIYAPEVNSVYPLENKDFEKYKNLEKKDNVMNENNIVKENALSEDQRLFAEQLKYNAITKRIYTMVYFSIYVFVGYFVNNKFKEYSLLYENIILIVQLGQIIFCGAFVATGIYFLKSFFDNMINPNKNLYELSRGNNVFFKK